MEEVVNAFPLGFSFTRESRVNAELIFFAMLEEGGVDGDIWGLGGVEGLLGIACVVLAMEFSLIGDSSTADMFEQEG
jgi:hypothetical protein